jgi:E3 ubiquitin-protein ligase HUWE1
MERLIDLIEKDHYSQSAASLDQLLSLLEMVVAPLSLLPKDNQDVADDSSGAGNKEWVKVPRVVVSKRRLHMLINTLRFDSCKDSSFHKVNTLTRRLSRVAENRECILTELALVAEGLGDAAILDLKAVSVRLSLAVKRHQRKIPRNDTGLLVQASNPSSEDGLVAGTPSNSVSLSTSHSELKLLRVLQMLNSLCTQDDDAKTDGNPPEFNSLLHSLNLERLWDELSRCLKTVSVLEGVAMEDAGADEQESNDGDNDTNDEGIEGKSGKKLQNSVAGLITRFLPAIEAFFMINASGDGAQSEPDTEETNSRVIDFAASNKILLNALLRSNPQLLEKGLKAMVKLPECRQFLDFDVKRQWFKTQVRRLRQQASRRHGSFRLNLRRKHVFEDSFHAFIHRNADELRGRLHITFQNEEGVDAGGLSREFFAILAKEMFNPNYALFMSTEDGCTFQPNPNSSINPDDLRYFRFVGRIVGKAVVDGFLLDAHFTRSLYKHMLGVKPTHHDMQAIDPDYYKNLQMILEHNLEDIGLELTFSTEDHSFGRSQTIDLIPNGRKIPVTDDEKARYVDLVCQHRMTTAIEKQIKAYLEGFHEMVDPNLISIFTAKELELLISGMPDIDIHDLKKNTLYNGYRPADAQIGWFWNIMFALTRSEKAAFLQFVTGSSKVPLAGFSELQGMRGVQKFSINKASGPEGALMSAHTCFNALDLPTYKSEEEMKEKLLYAISEGGGGFGFA